jgi:hypothetical protein
MIKILLRQMLGDITPETRKTLVERSLEDVEILENELERVNRKLEKLLKVNETTLKKAKAVNSQTTNISEL